MSFLHVCTQISLGIQVRAICVKLYYQNMIPKGKSLKDNLYVFVIKSHSIFIIIVDISWFQNKDLKYVFAGKIIFLKNGK